MTRSPKPRRSRAGMLVLALIVIFAGILAIIAFALDRASRSVLVQTWKAQSGHRLASAIQERFVTALSELGDDLARMPKTGPTNAIGAALVALKKGGVVQVVVPTTSPPELEPSPYQVGEVTARFEVVTGSLENLLEGWPLSESRFRMTTAPASAPTTAPASGPSGRQPPDMLPGTPVTEPPPSVTAAVALTSPIQPFADAGGPVCRGRPGTSGPHTCSAAVVALTLEATATVAADRHHVRRTLTETRLLHVLVEHVPDTLTHRVPWDMPREVRTELSVFYTSRRIREEGRE